MLVLELHLPPFYYSLGGEFIGKPFLNFSLLFLFHIPAQWKLWDSIYNLNLSLQSSSLEHESPLPIDFILVKMNEVKAIPVSN